MNRWHGLDEAFVVLGLSLFALVGLHEIWTALHEANLKRGANGAIMIGVAWFVATSYPDDDPPES